MYPEGIEAAKKTRYDLGSIEHILEGEFRPGHYQGVGMVVDRLLDIVAPLNVYLGQKDYQQYLVIRRLVGITGKKTGVIIVPTLREKTGLAMSSRNARLSENEKETASIIFRALSKLRSAILTNRETSKPIKIAMDELHSAGLRPEYVEVAHADDLSHLDNWSGKQDAVILAAAWMNDVRLIDNLYLDANI
jgi:pantoate--beta-alanine ligase